MVRKYSSESSDSEKRNRRKRNERRGERPHDDKHRERGSGKDLLDSDKRSRKRHGRLDERSGDDKDRERVDEKDIRDKDGRLQSKHVEQKQSRQSSDEEGEWVDTERVRRERERNHRHEEGHRHQETGELDKVKESRQSSDEEGEWVDRERGRRKRERNNRHEGHRHRETGELDKVKESYQSSDEYDNRIEREKRERERSRWHGDAHRQQETDDSGRKKDRHARQNSGDDDDRKTHRKSEQRKHRTEQQKQGLSSKGEDDRDSKALEDAKPHRQPRLQEGNLNGDASNLGKSGGIYIPPFKLARMMKEVEDKSSVEYQRLTWDALRKSINGLVNKVNAANIKNIIPELFSENLIRGRGLFCRSCMKSQMSSPGFTDVFAALVAVVNTKFPEVGDLLLRRIILQLKRAYKRNDKPQLLAAVKFIAHLVNQQVAHEIIALELLTVLLENPTDDSVEVAVGFVTECGSILQDLSPKGLHGIFERFRGILHEGEIDKRVQFLIEGLFAIRKAKFQGYPAVRPELDLVEQEDQLTHEASLQDEIDPEITLDIFKADPNFIENERRYEEVRKTILGEESDDEDGSDAGSDDDEDDEDESEEEDEEQMKIKDETETNLVNLRRTIYLTIMSSVDFEEAGHKLLKIKLEPGQEMELCIMLLECCSQERTYLRYYGLLGQRFCMINKVHQENFEKCFVQQYSMIHRLETNKLRNVGKFFAHLLGTDALPWHVLAYIRLTEEDTTSSSRIFIKILFQNNHQDYEYSKSMQ
ncbi:pre-mRNA-splicing factor CWC22 homolog isoform X2 [Carya illinoinensis]|uniref:MI domain-containing protein n=1 Tax=Carya illinoinensis TaxID=32201 RepID=A0A922DEE3_CARIL|nr:pre-mRNA-splicing factor CWC22 homolog isoform X2 [Carya illinoinensis]KAG6682849.1 hypothetical protein I3842_13G162700 [Carya illinoinensis]